MKQILGIISIIVITAALTWFLFPRQVTTGIPTIVTHWDTVETLVPRLDTVWRNRILTQVETLPNLIDTVTIQASAETVYVRDTTVVEIVCPQALQVSQYEKRHKPTTI